MGNKLVFSPPDFDFSKLDNYNQQKKGDFQQNDYFLANKTWLEKYKNEFILQKLLVRVKMKNVFLVF